LKIDDFMKILSDESLVPLENFDKSSDIAGTLGMQSMDVLQVIRTVEQQAGQTIAGVDMSQAQTVEGLYNALIGTLNTRRLSSILPKSWTDVPPIIGSLAAHVRAIDEFYPCDPLATAETLTDMVTLQAKNQPNGEALSFQGETLTYAVLEADTRRVAAGLQAHGIGHEDHVVLVMPNSADFFACFYGIQRVRATSVPVYHVPQPDRIARIVKHCHAKAIITLKPLAKPMRKKLMEALGTTEVVFLDVPTLLTNTPADAASLSAPKPADIAMLQYTSGTTGDSKGVMLTHAAILANIRQTIPTCHMHSSDVFASWLPVYHDMGLITMTMCPLYLGARLVLLPVALSADTWLNTIQRERATVTAAPDFAYRFVLRTCGDPSNYDLSSLRMALIAAEPIRANTVRAFEVAFQIPGIVRPGYGLAELTVGVSFYDFNKGSIEVDANGVVCVGTPMAEIEMTIRDASGHTLDVHQVGEICLKSPSQTVGYYRNADATRGLFTEDGAVRTGDLGYLDGAGQLYIVDRSKNVIIVAGRTLSPREIEEAADSVKEVALAMALGLDDGDDLGEQVHVFIETRSNSECADERLRIARDVRAQVQGQLGVRPFKVHVVDSGTIPRTYNGKLQYGKMRSRLRPERAGDKVVLPDPRAMFQTKRVQVIDKGVQLAKAAGLCHNDADAEQILDGRSFRCKGQSFVNFASCSYLGLEVDARLKLGAITATTKFGPCFSMSRAYASNPLYDEFETKLAEIFGAPAVSTPTTTLGSLSFMQTFINAGDLIVLDASVHNSVQLAASTTLQHGAEIITVPHNDMSALRSVLDASDPDRRVWYAADGIYSMFGDVCPIEEVIALLDEYPNLYCYADDAHGMSIHGKNGRGYVLGAQETLHHKMVVAVSLCKGFAMGNGGALIFPHEEWRRMLRTCGPTMIFSGPLSPPTLGTGVASANLHLSDEIYALQEQLKHRIALFRQTLTLVGLTSPSDLRSPVQFIHIGSDAAAMEVAAKVVEQGWFLNLAAFPAVGPGRAGLRLTSTNNQTDADIRGVVNAIREACQAAGMPL
jgi:acyl-CoA synthetase (AMP-forming)/AMP-acid ligase II/7-keto-8-aminopelargonate synthetase-like enzyme